MKALTYQGAHKLRVETMPGVGLGHAHKLGLAARVAAVGRLKPEVIISHRLKLSDAEEGYKIFDRKQDECRKVVLTP